MFDGRWRGHVDAAMKPVGRGVANMGITADMITASGLVISLGAAVAIGAGAFNLGLLLLILTGIPDLLDGAVAKASGRSSQRGAFFDSVSDRFTDGVLFTGVAYFYASTGEPPWLVILPVAAYLTASLVSYIRAKADALGYDAHVGVVERAERIIMLAVGILFGGPVLVVMLFAIVVLNVVTAAQRFVAVWRQATNDTPSLQRSPKRRRTPRASSSTAQRRSQWRARRRAEGSSRGTGPR
jgi:CDP-diacylglycerol---glycerol-3-phosphate 3-phosphatidyltransferase